MSVKDGIKNLGYIEHRDSIAALSHFVAYILGNLALMDMNDEGESQWLNTLLISVSNQPAEVLPDDAKRCAMGLIASVEHRLRFIAEREKNNRNGG